MEQFKNHLDELDKALKQLGYTGQFSCKGEHKGTLKECLLSIVNRSVLGIKCLELFSHAPKTNLELPVGNDNKAFCEFRMRYDAYAGFQILNVKVVSQHPSLKTKAKVQLTIFDRANIPSAKQMIELANQLKHTNVKSHRVKPTL